MRLLTAVVLGVILLAGGLLLPAPRTNASDGFTFDATTIQTIHGHQGHHH